MTRADTIVHRGADAVEKAARAYTPLSGAPYETDKRAHFLDYMAIHAPYKTVSASLCVMAINGLSRRPAEGSETVRQFMRSVTAVRNKLLKKYNRDLYSVPGVGLRASVDQDDRIPYHQKLKNRVASQQAKAVAHATTIRTEEIRDPKLKAGFVESKKLLLGATNDAINRMQKVLALPAKPEEK